MNVAIAKARAIDQQLRLRNAAIDARAKAMSQQIARVLRDIARIEALRVTRELQRIGVKGLLRQVRKDDDDELDREERRLREILRTFGLQQYDDAGKEGARQAAGKWTVRPTAITDFARHKEVQLQRILKETRAEVRSSVRDIITAALEQDHTPSVGDVARRIRNTFHGKEGAGGWLRDIADASDGSVLPTARYTTDEGTLYAFSSERAALIARNELGQAESAGIMEGYRVSGVEEQDWLAYRDGNSGARRHDLMHGQRRKLDEPFVNPTTGVELRHPHDPSAPISETANCRCSTAPVVRRR